MAGGRRVRPICAIESHKVHHFHMGPWIRNWTGLRVGPHEERWNHAPPVLVPAAVTAAPAVFTIPLTVTLIGSTERSADQAIQLVRRINHIFMAAGITFEIVDLAEWEDDFDIEKLPNGEWRCPFGEEVDHYVPCLHLGLVGSLGDLDALTLSCGRCLLLPDHTSGSEQRAGAEGLAALMGLMLVGPELKDRLMSEGGSGCRLTGPECEILRYHASHLLGLEPEHARKLALPVWAYQVCSPGAFESRHTVAELQKLWDGANEIWGQADLKLQMHAWCHLQQSEVSAAAWQAIVDDGLAPHAALLAPSAVHDAHALHAFFAGLPIKEGSAVTGQDNLLVVREETTGQSTVKALARVIGYLLGLHHVPQGEQLMCAASPGTLLTPHEVEIARAGALNLVYGA